MYQEERGFYAPEKHDQKIWRFMDFTKYVDLLQKRALYFCRLDNFEDPYEGAFPTNQVEQPQVLETTNHVRQFNFVNCWHMNEGESAAMWSIYLINHNGVAIQSNFERLRDSFAATEEDVFLSIVKYHDYRQKSPIDLINENPWSEGSSGSTINPQIFKRTSFDFERELRAIYIDLPIEYNMEELKKRNLGHGKSLRVDLDTLIEKIYVSPKADGWFKDLVGSVTEKYALYKPIEKSALYDRPNLR
jgi:hypothetical protein